MALGSLCSVATGCRGSRSVKRSEDVLGVRKVAEGAARRSAGPLSDAQMSR